MKLLVDIGNTRCKFINTEQVLTHQYQEISNSQLSAQWMTQNWHNGSQLLIASVNKTQLNSEIERWASAHAVTLNWAQSEAQALGVISGYQDPKQLGVDRWLALLAANSLFPMKNLLIIDAGTATTIDCLSAHGQHLGGWILAGIDLQLSSLITNTSNIVAEKNDNAQLSFGFNTSQCVNSACWATTIGAIVMAQHQANALQADPDHIILTGGNAHKIMQLLPSHLSIKTQVVDNLVLIGLLNYQA